MKKDNKIYIAGHTGMVGSAIIRNLRNQGYQNIIGKTFEELDLTNQQAVADFFAQEKPEYVFLAAAKVGGIMANDTLRGQFIYENLMIQNNIIHQSYLNGVTKLLFLGSSCIYPKNCPQPMQEANLLTSELEPTNEPYAIAKIAGIKMCENYYRQYGCNFISVMPTNLYGPNDNYNLANSHVLPAMIRKFHLGKCLAGNDWTAIRQDLRKRPIEGVDGDAGEQDILTILRTYGIKGPGHGEQGKVQNANCKMQSAKGTEHGEQGKMQNANGKMQSAKGTEHGEQGKMQNAKGKMQSAKGTEHGEQVSLELWGTGLVSREFMHVDDMAAACVYLMQHTNMDTLCKPPLLNNCFINIGTGDELTVAELADLVKKITGYPGDFSWDHSKPDGIRRKLLDCTKLQKTGFKPAFSLEAGIRTVYSAYSQI